KYKGGTYQGSGRGFRRGTTTVSVEVKNDKITDIHVLSYGDDAPYFEAAYSTVKSEILKTQSTDVDAVSGATFSSMGIMSAVEDALASARVS
ncbi:MAG: FMN-binding protein, partial [Bacillota bacterium]|nr:FMN-binding protein [Bacillota bacterium]